MITQGVANKSDLYKSFSKLDYSSNRQYLANIYGTKHEVQYYNDPRAVKKEKNKKIRKILLLSFVGVSLFSIAGAVAVQAAKGKVNKNTINETVEKSKNLAKEMGDKVAENEAVKKSVNALVNFSNVKDDYWTRFSKWLKSKKIGFVDSTNDYLEGIYGKLSKKLYRKPFNDAIQDIAKHKGDLKIKGLPKDFDGMYDKLTSNIKENISKDGRITEGLITRKIFSKEGMKNFYHKATDSIISEDKLKYVRQKFLTELEVPQGASKELEDAVKKYNKLLNEHGASIFERARDTSFGNAGTDALGMLASLSLLGGSVAFSDSKEERKSTVIKLGIPLTTTLASSIYALINNLSGGKALLFGFATGELASITASTVDKIVTKHSSKKEK